jgi:hypothetical protein
VPDAAYKPLRLSWSRLRVHDECPAKGDLISKKLKGPLTDTRNFLHGNVCDLAMRRFLSLEDPGSELGWMAAQVDALFDEWIEIAKSSGDGIIKWRSATDQAEVREFCREAVTRLEELLVRFVLPFDWSPAWRFAVPVKIHYGREVREITLVGETDLLVFDRYGRVFIWDLKATKDDSYWRKTLAQLAFYALAVKCDREEGVPAADKKLGRWPYRAGLLQPMCTERYLTFDIRAEHGQAIREMTGRIERVAADIWAGRLGPKPQEFCNRCEVRHACPLFAPGPGGKVRMAA